jgi:HK97 family phage portal protein
MNQTSLVGRPLYQMAQAVSRYVEKRGTWTYGQSSDHALTQSGFWGAPTSSGTGISVTADTALNYSVFWACVNNISTDVASLPLFHYKNEPNGGKVKLKSHKLYKLLHDAPNPEMDSMAFRETLQSHVLTWGNGYAEIMRDGAGQVAELWPITPDRVSVHRGQTGRLYYQVTRGSGGMDILAAEQMFHLHGLGYDGVMGYSIVARARETIGLGMAAQGFGETFFGNGASFGGVISLKTQLTEQAEESFRKKMQAQHGGVERAHKFLLLGNDAEYTRLGIPPNDAQFLETRQHQVEEICRWFRMPPHKVQHLLRSTNNNIEHQGIEYGVDTIRPWCVRWERAILRQLIAPSERTIQSVEHKMDALYRGDAMSRSQLYAGGRQWGYYSVNDVRRMENLDPIPDGDVYLSPQNMAPADRLDDIIDKQVEPDPTPTAPMPAQRDDAQVAALMADAIRAALAEVEARVADTTEKYVAAEADRSILRSDRDALLARMTEEQAEAGRLKAALLIATERADHLALKQDAARMAEATATAERDAAQAEVAQLKVLHAEAHARADALQVERDTVQASYAEATATAEQASAAHSQALIDLQTGADSERAALTQRVEELRTLLTSAESVRDERAVELDKRSDALALAQAQTVALAREVQTLTDAATAAQVRADEAIAETATVRTSADEALATQAAALAAEQAEKAALAKQLADVRAYADTVEATLKATQAEAEAAKVSAATSASLGTSVRRR